MINGPTRRQRGQERISCLMDVLINDSITCKAFDISEGGLYVRTDHTFNPGSVIKIVFSVGNEKLELKARVKHCLESFGSGLMFIDLDNVLKAKIRALILEIKKSS